MPTKYCPHCGFPNAYSVNPPEKCGKCRDTFASAFREVVAAKSARKVRQIFVDEDGNEVDAPEEVAVVRRVVKASKPLPKKSALDQLMRKKRMGDKGDDAEEAPDKTELPAEDDEGLSEAYSAEELAAALDPDDLVKETSGKDDSFVKLGSVFGKPTSETESPFGRRLQY